jgi:preprotein translocase subunit SecB
MTNPAPLQFARSRKTWMGRKTLNVRLSVTVTVTVTVKVTFMIEILESGMFINTRTKIRQSLNGYWNGTV